MNQGEQLPKNEENIDILRKRYKRLKIINFVLLVVFLLGIAHGILAYLGKKDVSNCENSPAPVKKC